MKKSIQNIVIVWRTSLEYLAKAGTETGASKTRTSKSGASKGPVLLGAGVFWTEFPSSSGSAYPTK